jgi:acetyl esterase
MTPQLDPQARALLEVMQAAGAAQPYELPVEQARDRMRAAFLTKGAPLELHRVEDISLPAPHGKLAMRLYRPSAGTLPLAMFLHGGGWTVNDLDTHDRLCRRIAKRSGWLLASLDYRRAPEHKHPAALEDALLAYRWRLDNRGRIGSDDSGVGLVGESSGGTMAACLTLLLRDLHAPMPVLQILAYPVTDGGRHWPSYSERGNGYTLDEKLMRWSMEHYLPAEHDLTDRYLFPMYAEDVGGLAPTLIFTAEFDPLRDEGIAYARKLEAGGVLVEHIHVEDQMHGFLLLDRAIAKAGDLIDQLADALAIRSSSSSRGAQGVY